MWYDNKQRSQTGLNEIIFFLYSDVPGSRIYFTVDGTKPDPFQVGRTGKSSTIKYIGPFRLQIGNRVIKSIAVSK
jgi:hypothetical protein